MQGLFLKKKGNSYNNYCNTILRVTLPDAKLH